MQDMVNSVVEHVTMVLPTLADVIATGSFFLAAPALQTNDEDHDVGGLKINSDTPDRLVENPQGLNITCADQISGSNLTDKDTEVPVGRRNPSSKIELY